MPFQADLGKTSSVTCPPLVSVVIPTYNRSVKVCAAVESVLGQTYPSVETIIVDDGSTDDTRSRLAIYGDRVRVLRQANAGPGAARNAGFRCSRGDFLAFLDSDDVYLPSFVESCVALLLRAGAGVPCCIANAELRRVDCESGLSFEGAGLRPRHPAGVWINVAEVLLTRFVVSAQTMVIRREAIDRVRGFDEGMRYLEDYKMALCLSTVGPWAFVSEPLVIWQQGPDSLSRKADGEVLLLGECWLRAVNDMGQFLPRADGLRYAQLHVDALRRARRVVARSRRLRDAGPVSLGYHRVLAGLRRLGAACYRRLPWYPGMDTIAIEEWGRDEDRRACGAPNPSSAEGRDEDPARPGGVQPFGIGR